MDITETMTNMKDRLIKEFESDPIYHLAMLNRLEDYLFTENILNMHTSISYSTVETGKIIERSDSTIRNHFRSDLFDYIAPERFGKFYRLNYQSVFRLHLIFLLMEKANKTTVDLLAELGLQPGMTVPSKRKIKSFVRDSQEFELPEGVESEWHIERIGEIERTLRIQGTMINILKYEKDLSNIDYQIDKMESLINDLKKDSEIKLLNEKLPALQVTSLRKGIKKSSFLGFLKQNNDLDINELSKEIDNQLREKHEKIIQDQITEYQIKIKQLKEEREKVKSVLEVESNKLSSLHVQSKSSMIE